MGSTEARNCSQSTPNLSPAIASPFCSFILYVQLIRRQRYHPLSRSAVALFVSSSVRPSVSVISNLPRYFSYIIHLCSTCCIPNHITSYNHQPISIRMPRGFDNNGLREFGDENEAVGSQGANCGTFSAFDRLLSQAATTVNNNQSSSPAMASTPGKCAIRGSCGSKGRFGPQLPCPYDGPPQEVRWFAHFKRSPTSF